jgi:hypothetical protein
MNVERPGQKCLREVMICALPQNAIPGAIERNRAILSAPLRAPRGLDFEWSLEGQ